MTRGANEFDQPDPWRVEAIAAQRRPDTCHSW